MNEAEDFFNTYFRELNEHVKDVNNLQIESAAAMVEETRKRGNKVFIVGNGGSAAIASHVSIDFTKAAKTRAICFNEASLLTCFSNDYGYENWVKEAVRAYCDAGDLGIFISSSGQSKNIINGMKEAKSCGISTIGLWGFDKSSPMESLSDISFYTRSYSYNMVENVHQIWLLATVDRVINRSCDDK